MLRLKEVELLGFKSFADRTRLLCDGTTAGIVGPNGCGKSNLADAVSWVLGEQSPRLLRGERMSDVIFNGTGTRPPTGLAEVTMTLVESVGSLAAADELERVIGVTGASARAEGPGDGGGQAAAQPRANGSKLLRPGEAIKVTRRLFRSGESEYLLNGDLCRLRDIQDVFMGTGLGPESYAIIEQGRIGQILSSKPADRRAIIEEAAGVSKFKSRKRLAEAKLESSRQNLARINDILEEISKQVNSLKRQASKAARYKELHQELRTRQLHVFASRLVALERECARLGQDSALRQQACDAALSELQSLERDRDHFAARYEQAEEEVKRTREALAASELESERVRSRLEQARQQAKTLLARAAEAANERVRLEREAEALELEASDRAAHSAQVRGEWEAARRAVTEITSRHEERVGALGAAETTAETRRREMLMAVSHASEARNEAVKAEEICHSAARDLARAQADGAAAGEEHCRAQAELESLRAAQAASEAARVETARRAAEAQATLENARASEATLAAEVRRLASELGQTSARRHALEESLARHAYSTDSVRRLLAPSARAEGFNPLGVVADYLEAESGYETVIEEFLKTELDCVVVERHDDARCGIALLQGDGGGRSTFFVRTSPANGHNRGLDRMIGAELTGRPGVVASLLDLVRFRPELGLNGSLAFPLLAHSFIVDDGSVAERLAAEFPSCHFLTRQGEHYHHRSVTGGRASLAGPLALRRDLRELDRHLADLEAAAGEAEAKWETEKARAAQCDDDLRRLSAEQASAEKSAVLSDEKLRQASEAAVRARAHLSAVESEGARLGVECEEAEGRRGALAAEVDAARLRKEQKEREATEAAEAARSSRQALDEVTDALREAEVKASALEERTGAAEAARERAAAEVERARRQFVALVAQTDAWSEQRGRLEAEAASAQSSLEAAAEEQQSARNQLEALREEAQQARARRDDLTPRADAARSGLAERKEMFSQAEVTRARVESALEHHTRQCRDELGVEPETLRNEIRPEDQLEGEPLELAEAEVRELKAKIERLGPVNMMALEELEEAEERLSFLDTQRQDLLTSIDDTVKTIREIEDASRRKFSDAFNAINSFFAESFRVLFGGGSGEMRFSDESDPESGIDIVAQPPGKRLQNVLLLSGGEKALTALALLIGVFRFSPSPFCILDEVDAPLDEANVARFARMIQSLSEQTQFILITHNKRTMEACRALYGVTMEEPGVSKLVSVRFEVPEPEPVAVPA